MAENTVTIVGNVTDDPELRYTSSGSAVSNFTVAVNARKKKNDEWVDELQGFFRCTCWRDMAENAAESVQKGMRVIVTGRLHQSTWENNDGQKRSAIEVQVDDFGPSLKWATAEVTKSERGK